MTPSVPLLDLGVIGSSATENEQRLPLHVEHPPHLDADLRGRITLEHGYGERFGVAHDALAPYVAGCATRAEILADAAVGLLEGGPAWDANETLSRAIEIREGRVVNPAILRFQGRSAEAPHALTRA